MLLLFAGATSPINAQPGVYHSNPNNLFYLPMDGPSVGAPESCAIDNPDLLSYVPNRFGKPDRAIHVNAMGSPSDNFYLVCANTKIATNPNASYTVGYWLQLSQFANGGNCGNGCSYTIFTIMAANSFNSGCEKYMTMSIGGTTGGIPNACVGGVNGTLGQFFSSTSVVDGIWHNLIWVFDYTDRDRLVMTQGCSLNTTPQPLGPHAPPKMNWPPAR